VCDCLVTRKEVYYEREKYELDIDLLYCKNDLMNLKAELECFSKSLPSYNDFDALIRSEFTNGNRPVSTIYTSRCGNGYSAEKLIQPNMLMGVYEGEILSIEKPGFEKYTKKGISGSPEIYTLGGEKYGGIASWTHTGGCFVFALFSADSLPNPASINIMSNIIDLDIFDEYNKDQKFETMDKLIAGDTKFMYTINKIFRNSDYKLVASIPFTKELAGQFLERLPTTNKH
jgi:hypothetical protein